MTQTVLLGDLMAEKGYIRGPFGSALRRPEMKSEGIPVYEQQNAIYNHRDFRFFIDDQKHEELKRFTVKPGDLLISCSGTLGRITIIRPDDPIGIISQALLILRVNQEKVLPEYLYYFLTSTQGQYLLLGASHGSVQTNIAKRAVVEAIKIELPSLPEQREIVDILGTIDEKIELNRKMNETLEQMGQALFRHYFIDNPEAEKWGKKTIDELCSVKIGRTPPRKESEWFDKNDGEAWVSIKDMGQGAIFISDSSEYLIEDAVTKFNVPAIELNTILLSFKLTVGRLCISTKRMYSNEAIAQLPLKSSEVSTEYLYYFLRNFNYGQLSSTSSIATAVNSTTVKSIKVTVPIETVMKDFTAQAHDILEAVKNNEAEIQTLTTLRDTLLPRLISGKIEF